MSLRGIVAGVGQVTLFVLGGEKRMKTFVAKALDAQRVDRVGSTPKPFKPDNTKKRFRL